MVPLPPRGKKCIPPILLAFSVLRLFFVAISRVFLFVVQLLTHLRYFHLHSYSFEHFLYFKPLFSSPLPLFAWFSRLPCECASRRFCLRSQLFSSFHPVSLVFSYFLFIYSFSCAISCPFL